jgi:hypothetical protein
VLLPPAAGPALAPAAASTADEPAVEVVPAAKLRTTKRGVTRIDTVVAEPTLREELNDELPI